MEVIDLGVLSYAECVDLQHEILGRVLKGGPDTLLLVEHPPVITLGAGFHPENLIATEDELRRAGIEVHKSERGGDITYHGPGQLVAYPIFDLSWQGKDLHKWLRSLEETVLLTLDHFGLTGRRFSPHTGVWIGDEKVCAMGVKVRRWISFHGLALNCNNELSAFRHIVPCGIQGYRVTSLTECAGRNVAVEEAKPHLVGAFESVFGPA